MTQKTFGKPSALPPVGSDYNSEDYDSEPCEAHENIDFGQKTVKNSDGTCSPIGTTKILIALGGNLGSGNTFACTLKSYNVLTKVETVSSISVPYNTSASQSVADIVTAVKLNTGVKSTTSASGNNISIYAKDDYILEISSEAVSGGSAVAVTKTNSDTRLNYGFALFVHKQMFEDNGALVSRYKAGDIASIGTAFRPVVSSPSGFDVTDSLFYLGYGTSRGQISNVVGNNGIAVGTDVKPYLKTNANNVGVLAFRLNNIG